MEDLNFAQMLCSRLCHDLITPIGAINSGFEILQECDDDHQTLMDLTKSSAETAARRLSLYRTAYGYSGVDMSSKFISIQKFIEDFLTPLKISLKWDDCEQCNQNPFLLNEITIWSKILINSVLLASESLPYGGEIRLTSHNDKTHFKFSFDIQGKFVGFRPELLKALQNELKIEDYTPQVIHGILLLKLLQKLKAKFVINLQKDYQFALEISK